jgi:hypothetical protein
MFNTEMIERLASAQRSDLSKEVELVRLPKASKSNGSTSLKLAVVMSGAALVALVIVQMFVI